jgi:membrane associated rhomboid family serine protease
MPRYPSRYSAPSSFSFGPGPISTALKAIIGLNVAVFLTMWVMPAGVERVLTEMLGLVPFHVVRNLWIWQLVTYMFVHASTFHLLFNMLALWMFGAELERTWGTRYFLKFYFVTGIGAGLLTVLFSLVPYGPTAQLYGSDIVGASGAIYGLLLAYGLYFPNRPIYMYFVFPIPAKIFVIIMGALAFLSSMSANGGGVANATHLGGLLVAYVYLKGLRLRLNPWAEVKYRYLKWKMSRVRKKFDVYSGGRSGPTNGWDRRVH